MSSIEMKDNPTSPSTSTSSTQPVVRKRKKPHKLPPLQKPANSGDPENDAVVNEILLSESSEKSQAAKQVEGRPEMGSPTPQWRLPNPEEQQLFEEPATDGRPVIRLTRCPDIKSSLPVAQTKQIPSRYTLLEPIKGSNNKQT